MIILILLLALIIVILGYLLFKSHKKLKKLDSEKQELETAFFIAELSIQALTENRAIRKYKPEFIH